MGAIRSNRKVIAAKIETTEGTAIAVAAGDANVQIMEPKFDLDLPMYDRKILDASLSPYKSIPGTRLGRISFKAELRGSGTAGTAPALGKFLKACGMAETVVASTSVTYAPTSTAATIPSLTVAQYIDGIRQQIKGARGSVKYSSKVGEPGMLEFEFLGVYDAVTDQTILTPTGVESTVPIALLSSTFSIASFSAFASSISWDMANVLSPRQDLNQASGYISTLITDRALKGSFDPELETVATYDWFGKLVAATTGALTWKHPGTAGNICTFTIPVCQAVKLSPNDRNGIAALTMDYLMARNSGDDELSIAFT